MCNLEYGLAFIRAIKCIREAAYEVKPGLRKVHEIANEEGVYIYGSWDDSVERMEFYREHTLLSCGSPRLDREVAHRLLHKEDKLRQNPDCALLYYTLARTSIENDQMMQDDPERALNTVFARLKSKRDTGRSHVELVFSLQQAVLDGLEYLEENKRELPIWGIPPFETHQIHFHPEHTPTHEIRQLIQQEMDLVAKDFDQIIAHWKLLRDKVDRYLDVLLQFRVLEQQELTVSQTNLAAQQQRLGVEEAREARVQSRSVVIFTAITIIFLPLSFFTSYFGMNVKDVVNTTHSSGYFWIVAGPVSGGIVLGIFAIVKYTERTAILDAEKALATGRSLEIEKSWQCRLGLRRAKMKKF
ncbi:hypothetical protein Tdes44962_MAKER08801 [Teratosphaeria destructans]|uniref:Uncharacterized protein n=1 Tax=Teratosphaeria destructans TaxID=418781 RepID=A0A9W7SVK8_9PEZI|nr:hypothetical protein Tdes44962_MAKER08801 [Teratosphaeria destructans]